MKILFFADLHGDMNTLEELKRKSLDADTVVCAGDISTMDKNIPAIISNLSEFNGHVFIIHGNHEDERGLKELCARYENITFLHKAVHHMGDYAFVGYGGDGFSTNDPEFTRVANMFFKKEIEGKNRIILVTHGPPFGTKIDKIGNDYRGNKSYRQFIDSVKPHLVVSGHLHENAGKHDKIGRTLFINPGKDGVIVEI